MAQAKLQCKWLSHWNLGKALGKSGKRHAKCHVPNTGYSSRDDSPSLACIVVCWAFTFKQHWALELHDASVAVIQVSLLACVHCSRWWWWVRGEQGLDRASSSLMRNGSRSLVLELIFVVFCQFFSPFRSTVRKKTLFQTWCMPGNLELKDAQFWGEQLVLCSVEVLTFFMDIKGLFSPIKSIVTQLSLLCTRLVWLGEQSDTTADVGEDDLSVCLVFALIFLWPLSCLLLASTSHEMMIKSLVCISEHKQLKILHARQKQTDRNTG